MHNTNGLYENTISRTTVLANHPVSVGGALTAEARRWDLVLDFNGGTQGQQTSEFTSLSGDTTYETSAVTPYEGNACARVLLDVDDPVKVAAQSYGDWGGKVDLPVPLQAGDELFIKFYCYIPSANVIGVTDGIKWIRFTCFELGSDENGTRLDWYYGGGNQLSFRFEDANNDVEFDYTLPRDQWFEFRSKVFLHPTQGSMHWWINDSLIELRENITTSRAEFTDTVVDFLLHTTFNGTYPAVDEVEYYDSFLITSDRATAIATGDDWGLE